MKVFATALALMAGSAVAHTIDAYIPHDCFYEDTYLYGKTDGTKVSDYLNMTGLDAYAHKLVQVTACRNNQSGLLSGVTTKWAKWENGAQVDAQNLNMIGKMSALYHWSDSLNLDDARDYTIQQYWFQEAEPSQEQEYLSFDIGSSSWASQRQTLFNNADTNGDGSLDRTEGADFLSRVRPLDFKDEILDTRAERVDQHYDAILALSGGSSMSFNDYQALESQMKSWY